MTPDAIDPFRYRTVLRGPRTGWASASVSAC